MTASRARGAPPGGARDPARGLAGGRVARATSGGARRRANAQRPQAYPSDAVPSRARRGGACAPRSMALFALERTGGSRAPPGGAPRARLAGVCGKGVSLMTLDDPRWTIVGHRGSPIDIKLAPLPQAAALMRAAAARAVIIIKNSHHFKILRHALRAALGRARPAHRFSGPPPKVPDGAVPGVRGILAAGMSPSGGSSWRRRAAGCCWAARSCTFCEASSLKVWKNRSNFKECD